MELWHETERAATDKEAAGEVKVDAEEGDRHRGEGVAEGGETQPKAHLIS